MREIKFKAFCKKENKIYDVQSIEFVDLIEGRTGINVYAGEDIYEECKWLEEGEYVLMQFTGLKDKTGKEIYEGYIVICHNLDGQIKGVVSYEVQAGCYWIKWTTKTMQRTVNSYGDLSYGGQEWSKNGILLTSVEVIGNIYTNPELLNL